MRSVVPAPERSDKDADSDGGPAGALRSLQQAAGNAAVGRLIEKQQPTGDAGAPLPANLRRSAERKLDTDLGAVRIHGDSGAGAYAAALGAEAVTIGQDVYFRDGAPDPSTSRGAELYVHELAHAAQASGIDASTAAAPRPSRPGSRAEREASRIAQSGLGGPSVAPAEAAPVDVAHRQAQNEEELLSEATAPGAGPAPTTAPASPTTTTDATGAVPATPAAAAPAASPLAALFDATVLGRVRSAHQAVTTGTPDLQGALGHLQAARNGLKALAGAYRETDPALHSRLWVWHNALLVVIVKIGGALGNHSSNEEIAGDLSTAVSGISDAAAVLH